MFYEDMPDSVVGYTWKSGAFDAVIFSEFSSVFFGTSSSYFELGNVFENSLLAGIKREFSSMMEKKGFDLDLIVSLSLKTECILNSFEILRQYYHRPKDYVRLSGQEILGYAISEKKLDFLTYSDLLSKNKNVPQDSLSFRKIENEYHIYVGHLHSLMVSGKNPSLEFIAENVLDRCALLNLIAASKYYFNYMA